MVYKLTNQSYERLALFDDFFVMSSKKELLEAGERHHKFNKKCGGKTILYKLWSSADFVHWDFVDSVCFDWEEYEREKEDVQGN